jgi:hypothetical protein
VTVPQPSKTYNPLHGITGKSRNLAARNYQPGAGFERSMHSKCTTPLRTVPRGIQVRRNQSGCDALRSFTSAAEAQPHS